MMKVWDQFDVSIEPNQNGTKINGKGHEMYLLEHQNKMLEERLIKVERQMSQLSGKTGDHDYDTASYREEIMFLAENRNIDSDVYLPTGNIGFETVQVDPRNSFSGSSGQFTAPEDGIYIFQFMCYTRLVNDDFAEIKAYVNGMSVQNFWNVGDSGRDYAGHLSLFFSWNLKANDKLWLYNNYAESILVDEVHSMFFMGKRLIQI